MRNPYLKPALRPLLLAIALASQVSYSAALAETGAAHVLQQEHRFDISAQPLPEALLAFADQAGLRLSFASDLVPEHTSRALHGQMSRQQALSQLLQGQAVEWHLQDDGSLLLLAAVNHAKHELALPSTMVQSEFAPQGETRYDREHLSRMPIRQGQIAEVLRQNPAVAFDKSSLSSKTPANLEAKNVSINGAKYWDNNFSVDGISMNNDLNPGGKSVSANSSMTDLPANTSQGMNLDVSLLESIQVYDSNVPAEYGGFTGGVVDAQTRRPSQKLSGSASVSMTKDSWTEYHIDERNKDDFYNSGDADGTGENQPKFRTLTYRATLEGHLTDNFGLMGSLVRKQSDIYDQNIYASDQAQNGVSAPTKTDLGQTLDNLFLKAVWQANDRLTISGTLNYAPQEAEYFNINTLDGAFEMESGGLQTSLQVDWQGDWGTWQHNLSWSELEQSRQNGANYFKAWYYSADKNWADPTQRWNAAMEGSYGNIEQDQKRLSYNGKLELLPMQWGSTIHQVKLGVGFEDTEASYSRDAEFIQANGVDLVATTNCTTASGQIDNDYCSASPVLANPYSPWQSGAGQMYRRLYFYQPGEVKAQQQSWSAFIEDQMQWHDVTVRAGLRAEQNDFNKNLNIAPRLSLTWDLFSDGQTKLITGANRYYGREIFDYRLREGREAMRYYSLRDSATLEFSDRILAGKSTTNLAGLETPYDDELTFGIEQIAFDTLFSLRYVHRNGQKQIHRRPITNDGSRPELSTTYYQYSNEGSTDSRHYYLTITPLRSLNLAGTQTQGSMAFGWSDIESSNRSYDDDFDDTLVMYQGKPIKAYEIPVDNYTRPWTAKLITQTQIPAWNLTIGNFLNFRAAYSQVMRDGRVPYQGQNIYNYVEKDVGSAFTWDTRLAWELPLGSTEAAFANLDVGNVLNHRNSIGSSSSTNLSSEVAYELGRNYTLEVGYRF